MLASTIFSTFGANPRLNIHTLVSSVPNTENALCAVRLLTSGGLQFTQGGGGGVVTNHFPEWWGQPYPASVVTSQGFDARLQVFAGSAPNTAGSPVNAWVQLGVTTLFWELFVNLAGQTLTATWVIEIRSRANLQVLANNAFFLTSTKAP